MSEAIKNTKDNVVKSRAFKALIALVLVVIGVGLGFYGEGLLYAITNRDDVLTAKNHVVSPVESPKVESVQ